MLRQSASALQPTSFALQSSLRVQWRSHVKRKFTAAVVQMGGRIGRLMQVDCRITGREPVWPFYGAYVLG